MFFIKWVILMVAVAMLSSMFEMRSEIQYNLYLFGSLALTFYYLICEGREKESDN